MWVSPAEGLDGDGVPELIVASLAASDGVPQGGRVDVISGATGAVVRTMSCATPLLNLGHDVHPVGDANGDGVGDVFITGRWALWHPEFKCRGVLVAGRRVE